MIKKTLILSTILALTACGGGSDSNDNSNPPPEQTNNTAPTISAAYTTIYMDENSTLWNMMNSDILVVSRSTFPISAAFMHTGSNVFYPKFRYTAGIGLGTKYDKGNWTLLEL